QLSKVRTRSFRIIGEWRYGHEAADVEVVELRCGLENGIEFMRLGIDATLCLFTSHVHFDQNAQSFPQSLCRGIQFFGELHGIDGIDCGKKLSCLVSFVGLQMTDQVPLGVEEITQGIALAGELLDAIFAE